MAIDKKYEGGVVLLSGGLDSAVATSEAQLECSEVSGLFLDYRQRTLDKERACAEALADHFRLKCLKTVDISFLADLTGAPLCNAGEQVSASNEYVPFRNGLFLAIATALAESVRANVIYIGSTGSDTICRDNRPGFHRAFEYVIEEGTNTSEKIIVSAPLIKLDKQGVIRRGLDLGTPLNLTWSCHNKGDKPCSSCSNCQSRQAAFDALKIKDPALTF